MDIYFLRHGDAASGGERPLTDKGRKQGKTVANALNDLGLEVDAIYTSPLVRARQTAEIAGDALGVEPRVSDLLDSGATLDEIAKLLAGCGPDDRVMLVGHEPDFSAIVGQLIGGGRVEMKKAGVARIECSRIAPESGVLKWLLTPKVMG